MTKIFNLINYHSSYGKQVRLLEYYYDDKQNLEHMMGYRPIRSHREAFLELAQAQLPDINNKEKVLMLTGSIGTGKSHLCLMLANYFSLKVSDIEMRTFFENWVERDPDGAEKLQTWRGDGRYLVAPCDFGKPHPFEDMVLNALERALKEEGAEDIALSTHFKGALRLIDNWEERQKTGEPSGIYEDFLSFLGGDDPQSELETLKKDLANNDSAAMKLFQSTYQKAAGQKFAFRLDNLKAILTDLLSSKDFQKRYKGLVIIADEFGYALNENRVTLSVFQAFAEMSKDGIDGMQLIFVGVGHRRLLAYANNPSLQIDFRVVADRTTEVSLESEELEQIISSLISPKTQDPIWLNEVISQNDWLLSQMASKAKKFMLFDYLSEPDLKEQIVENIYPMHPMATYCLTKMSQEMGSDARSVFAFFRDFKTPLDGSYTWFVKNFDVTKPNGELNIYTTDFLARYFRESEKATQIDVRPEIKEHIRNYHAAVEEARRYAYQRKITKEIDPFTQKVLDLIFVYRVSNINVVQETLGFGLNIQKPNKKKSLVSEIKALIKDKILFTSPSGEYEFRRSDMLDLDALIAEQRQEIVKQPLDISKKIISLATRGWDDFLEAKGHNQIYLGDKRVLRVFATPQELSEQVETADGATISYWAKLEQQRLGQKSWGDRYDGTLVLVLCENETDIKTAQQAVKSNDVKTIIVGIPKNPMPIRNVVIYLMAVLNFKDSEEYTKMDFQEKALVDERLGKENQKTGRYGDLIRAREQYFSANGLYWYREDGKTHLNFANNEYEPADELMNRLYDKRNNVSHEYLSKAHPRTFSGKKDSPLNESIERLVSTDKPIEIDHSQKENKGEIRYLLKALANHGVLVQEGDYEGNIAYYQLETNIDRYRSRYPALVDLIEELKQIDRGENINLWYILSKFTDSPYGLGPYALSLFTACAFRFFGDELRLKINPQGFGYSPTDDPEIIIDVATGQFPKAEVERRVINAPTASLINKIYNLFANKPAPAATQQTLSETWQALLNWWKGLTRLEKALGIYDEDSMTFMFVDFMSKYQEDSSGSQVFLEEIKKIYGFSQDAELEENQTQEIISGLTMDKELIENRSEDIKSKLIENLSSLFGPAGNTYKNYIDAIYAWYENLHPDQKLINADWQTPVTKSILDSIPKLQDLEKMFLEIIPESFGFRIGKVDDWSLDHSENYISKFSDALEKINNSLPKVPTPIWETSVGASNGYQGVPDIRYRQSVTLKIAVPEGGSSVKVTKGVDPIDAKQFEIVDKSKDWSTEVTDSCTYFLVTQNEQGDYGKIIQLNFTNLDESNKLIMESAPALDPGERLYRFNHPIDKAGLVVLLKDIVEKLQSINSEKRIPDNDILAAFREVTEKLNKASKDKHSD